VSDCRWERQDADAEKLADPAPADRARDERGLPSGWWPLGPAAELCTRVVDQFAEQSHDAEAEPGLAAARQLPEARDARAVAPQSPSLTEAVAVELQGALEPAEPMRQRPELAVAQAAVAQAAAPLEPAAGVAVRLILAPVAACSAWAVRLPARTEPRVLPPQAVQAFFRPLEAVAWDEEGQPEPPAAGG
jgi:hypothetical protein